MSSAVDLSRFTQAYKGYFGNVSYQTAFSELQNGRKITHWMWYIFPQIHGLGRSSTSQYYAIQSIDEAKAFLNDSYLGESLRGICSVLLKLETNNPTEVFGWPDDMKLKSSMTLFASVSEDNFVFHKVLEKFFNGEYDKRTLNILGII